LSTDRKTSTGVAGGDRRAGTNRPSGTTTRKPTSVKARNRKIKETQRKEGEACDVRKRGEYTSKHTHKHTKKKKKEEAHRECV
jgi:hypothetical protein